MIRVLRESLAAKLLVALVGTVGLLLGVAYVVVRQEASQQVERAVATAVSRAQRQLDTLETLQHEQVARMGRALTESRRTLAALDDAISAGDSGVVADVVSQQLAVAALPDSNVVVAFTDPNARPVLTFFGAHPMAGADPVNVTPVAARVLQGASPELRTFRVVSGQLYTLSTQVIQLAGRTIGTVSFGLPLRNADAQRVSDVVGAQVCYLVDGQCVAGARESRGPLARTFAEAAGRPGTVRVHAAGREWSIRAEPLSRSEASQGYRVIAVPLDGVLAPFQRIIRALAIGGAAALVLSVLLGVILSRGLTRPVRALVDAAGRVGQGDYDTEVTVRSRDELGTLARAFNDMTRGLLLKERYRSVLHKVVSRDVAEELMSRDVELGGETRDVSVLFADLRGFTALTEGMEPQAVIALLNECMERLSAAVETEGGVVDKYVGDEIMAVFGAPVPQPDHADRAVCAAVRMRRAMAELNAVRAARHEPPLAIGAGINSGSVVAGNMGSSDRLNYTVLGETVNLAARLCAGAGADEILVTARTAQQVRARAEIAPLGPRRFKGFAADIDVSAVRDIPLTAGRRRVSGPAVRAVTTALILAAWLAVPAAARAQGAGGLPTLRGLGLGYESSSGRYQIAWSGQLDLELLSLSAPDIGLVKGNGTFLSPRLRVYTDMFAGDHVYGLVELSADGGEAPTRGLFEGRVEQAYVRVSNGGGTLAFQAGRFANPFGPYQARHLTPQDLFVRPSLPYDYRTIMSRTIVAADPAAFQSWQDRAGFFRPNGAPPVWQVPYPWGAMALGTVGRVSYRVAAVNSAPSSEPAAWYLDADGVRHPSWVGAVRVAVTPSLAVEGSYDSGPYLGAVSPAALPAGRSRWSYRQTLWSEDVAYARGPVMADAELLDDRWDVPHAGTALHDLGYVASVQSDLAAGVFAALRWSYLDFRPWTDESGRAWSDWDHDVARMEASLGYRIATNAGVLASVLSDRQRVAGAQTQNLFAVRWWWAF